LVFRTLRSGAVYVIFVYYRHGHPPPGAGPARPEGCDASPARRCATGARRQARREERRSRQDVPDPIAG